MKNSHSLDLRRSIRGFSLIELIVSIAIVAILAMILIVTIGRARESANTASCRSNLRQLAIAGLAFANDNRGRLPDRTAWAYHPTNAYSLVSYLGLAEGEGGGDVMLRDTVLSCPSIQASDYRAVNEFHRSYSINQYASGSDNSSGANRDTWVDQVANRGAPQILAAVKSPSTQSFFMDGAGMESGEGFRYSVFTAPSRLKGDPVEWHTVYIHRDAINVAYLDGHVASVSLEEAKADLIGSTNSGSGSPRVRPFWGAER